MNLEHLLARRVEDRGPVRVGLIGAGKFGSMILSQARHIDGLHIAAIADLDPTRASAALARVGWAEGEATANSIAIACRDGTTFLTDDASDLFAAGELDCIVEATGHPLAGVRHALAAIDAGQHVVMVNVEADVLLGPLIAERARAAGVVYSMAYGDQPAAIAELVDWCRVSGFELVAAGKGMNFAPPYRYSTPDTVWSFFGWSEEDVAKGDFNPKMYNSFTDGTKAAIEMAAVANATGLDCPEDGLKFHPAGLHDLAEVFKPISDGGQMEATGLVDIAASREPDGRVVQNHIQYGMFVTFRAPNAYTRDCFQQYGLMTDKSGWFGSMWRPFHLIGLETSVSILNAVLRGEATGSTRAWRGDAVSTAKRDLAVGEQLDGEGGYTVWAKAIPAARSRRLGALPIGLAHDATLRRPVAKDDIVTLDDIEPLADADMARLREDQTRLMTASA